ncbi:MAG: helix-turn-helix domain-containing protein [Phascolarctobacterium sp.]|nr:helix-turn-helix domain-containing protein [Phascolarctobacterium sp.]
MIAPTVKSMLVMEGMKRNEAAAALGITAQAMSNKYNRDSFSADDLLKVATAAGYNLAFVRKRDGLMITFPAAAPAEAGQE